VALPGPNVVNLVTMIGRLLRGPLGAAAAFSGLVAPAIAINALLVAMILPLSGRPEVIAILAGLAAAATGLAIINAGQMAHLHLRRIPDIVLALVTVIVVIAVRPPLIVSMVVFGGVGIALHYFHRARSARESGDSR